MWWWWCGICAMGINLCLLFLLSIFLACHAGPNESQQSVCK